MKTLLTITNAVARKTCMAALGLTTLTLMAQPRYSVPHGIYDSGTLTVAIEPASSNANIYYTTDGSEPTAQSKRYTAPLSISSTTIVRAVEQVGDSLSPIATASYIFTGSVLSQTNTPSGYPAQWGQYTTISGTATADYEMDPEMTSDQSLRQKIIVGLKELPVMSIVSDKDNFFSHENDPDRGGIYIFTGPPVGDPTGHGWTRPASVELFGGPQQHDMSTTCGVRLHGGHGRLAEKNPKHSFRLVFKEKYGPKTLKYPLYGEDEPKKFDQLVLRCHFGNSWQHWDNGNRQKAQYTRDVWARRMQRRLGNTSVNALYAHLFINGMYWGIYNVAERVDAQFGQNHLGGKESDIDVVKIEEDGGNHLEASEGTLDAFNEMVSVAQQAADDRAYERLDTLLDIDQFIDYMLINQYGGNTDWDHHNWYAIRRKGPEGGGFKFLCWDTEIIFENEYENVLQKNNGNSFPTGIFHNLMRNEQFARKYVKRAKELLADDGQLGPTQAVELWDSLYYTISNALYCEAARWGDYRRDVHRWQSRGDLYTVDYHYMNERNRLLNNYFPVRSERVLGDIIAFTGIDDFEAPDNWSLLTASMWCRWNGTGADAQPVDYNVGAEMNLNTSIGGGGVVAGLSSVTYNIFADLTDYDKLVIRGKGSGLRVIANRLTDHGPYKIIILSLDSSSPYWDSNLQAVVLPLDELKTAPTNQGVARNDNFLHLNAIKVDNGNTATVTGLYLIPTDTESIIPTLANSGADNRYYNMNGQQVAHPKKGIYIMNGHKVVIK